MSRRSPQGAAALFPGPPPMHDASTSGQLPSGIRHQQKRASSVRAATPADSPAARDGQAAEHLINALLQRRLSGMSLAVGDAPQPSHPHNSSTHGAARPSSASAARSPASAGPPSASKAQHAASAQISGGNVPGHPNGHSGANTHGGGPQHARSSVGLRQAPGHQPAGHYHKFLPGASRTHTSPSFSSIRSGPELVVSGHEAGAPSRELADAPSQAVTVIAAGDPWRPMTGLSGRPPSGPHARRPGTASSAAGGGVRNALAPHTYQLPGVGGQKEPRGHEMPGAPRALRSQAHMARGGGERRGGQDAGLLATGAGALTSGPGAAGREGGGGPAGGGRVEESQARGRAESWISSGRDSSPGGSETSRLASDGVPGTAAQTQTVPVPVEKPSLAVIKVVDQGRGEEKEFKCHLSTLVEHMQYFESYLDGVNVSEKVEISVFCDVEVFTWLLTWARAHSPEGLPAGVSPPELHVSQSVSILIAAHFLRMSRLVPEALSFVRQRFLQVVFLPLDLTGLADDLTAPLQASLSDDDIEAAWVLSHDSGEVARRMQAAAGLAEPPESKEVAEQGRRVRLMVNKLYRARLQALVERPGVDLTACEACGEVYSARLGSRLPCGSARMFVGFRGDVVTRHVADPAWSAQDYITALRQQRLPWRTIFWRTWAATEALWCTHCRHWYVLSQVGRCMHHREPPLFGRGKNTGVFPCCGGNAFRFGGGDAPGCSPRPHEIGPAPSDVEEGVPQGQRGGERAGAEAEAAVVSRLERFRRLIDAPLPDEAERAAGKSGGKGWESASSRGMSSSSVRGHVAHGSPSSPGKGPAGAHRRFPEGYTRSRHAPEPAVLSIDTLGAMSPAGARALRRLARAVGERGVVEEVVDGLTSGSSSDSEPNTPRVVAGAAGAGRGERGPVRLQLRGRLSRPFDGLVDGVAVGPDVPLCREILRDEEATRLDAMTHALVAARQTGAAVVGGGGPGGSRAGAGCVMMTDSPATPVEQGVGRSPSPWATSLLGMAQHELLARGDKRTPFHVVLAGGQYVGHMAVAEMGSNVIKYAIPLLEAGESWRSTTRPSTARSASMTALKPPASAAGGARPKRSTSLRPGTGASANGSAASGKSGKIQRPMSGRLTRSHAPT